MCCEWNFYSGICYHSNQINAAMNSLAYDGGCELVLLSDIAVAADNAHFAGVHDGGSPVLMEEIGVRSEYDLESRKEIVKYLAGITD